MVWSLWLTWVLLAWSNHLIRVEARWLLLKYRWIRNGLIWNVRILLWLMWCRITWVRLMWYCIWRLLSRIWGVRRWGLIWIWRCTWIRHCFILTVIVCWRNSVVCQVNHDNKLCLFGISVFDSALHFLSMNSLRSVYFHQNIWLHYSWGNIYSTKSVLALSVILSKQQTTVLSFTRQ